MWPRAPYSSLSLLRKDISHSLSLSLSLALGGVCDWKAIVVASSHNKNWKGTLFDRITHTNLHRTAINRHIVREISKSNQKYIHLKRRKTVGALYSWCGYMPLATCCLCIKVIYCCCDKGYSHIWARKLTTATPTKYKYKTSWIFISPLFSDDQICMICIFLVLFRIFASIRIRANQANGKKWNVFSFGETFEATAVDRASEWAIEKAIEIERDGGKEGGSG